uniref:Zn-ribbon protein n=1 Tax=Desulfovibrio sp. U5L TaxID=596152 RepID=I2Q0M7_9BACT
MYLKQIEQLVVLQKVDDEIVILQDELKRAPLQISELEKRRQEIEEGAEIVRDKLKYLTDQQKRLESEIETDSVRLKKSKSKMMMVGNTKEYHAMMREMDNLEKQNRGREEEKITVAEELARQNLELKTIDERAGGLGVELAAARQSLDERIAVAKARLTELEARRSEAGQAVPKPILQRYEFIRSRLKNPVIVPVAAGICSGCHISIPPQSFIELQKGVQILSCPNCQRLIYWSDHIAPEPTPETEETTAE